MVTTVLTVMENEIVMMYRTKLACPSHNRKHPWISIMDKQQYDRLPSKRRVLAKQQVMIISVCSLRAFFI